MPIPAGKLVVNDGVSQAQRRLPALDPGWAPVDGRTQADLAAFAGRYGELVTFWGMDNHPAGTWKPFFTGDSALALSALAAIDPALETARFRQAEQAVRDTGTTEGKFAALQRIFAVIRDLALAIDSALAPAMLPPTPPTEAPADPAPAVHRDLQNAIRGPLGMAVRQLRAWDLGAAEALGQAVDLDYGAFSPFWHLDRVNPDPSFFRGGSARTRIDNALPGLAATWRTVLGYGSALAEAASDGLDAALAQGNHQPHAALYMAFTELFGTAQNSLNSFQQRLIEFYYRDLLREAPAGPVGDSLALTFTLADNAPPVEIAAGTVFTAGQDPSGLDLLYATDRPVTVVAATVADIRALRVICGPLFPGAADTESLPQQIVTTRIAPAQVGEKGWPTFGAAAPGKGAGWESAAADVGFAVASTLLLLRGGTRTVRISGAFTADAREILNRRLTAIAEAAGVTAAQAFATIASQAFVFTVSTASGWFAVPSYTATFDGTAAFSFAFTLDPTAPPVTARQTDPTAATPADGGPAPLLPTVSGVIRPQAVTVGGGETAVAVMPLSLFSGLATEKTTLAVTVNDLDGLVLSNTDGPVAASSPFPVFGASPIPGAYLDIAAEEVFLKTPDDLSVTVNWMGLPTGTEGFKAYYRDYVIGPDGKRVPGLFDNATFKSAFSVVTPGTWDAAQSRDLFDTDPPLSRDGALLPATRFTPRITTRTAPQNYQPSDSALRISLTAPSYGFGADLYPKNVLAAVIHDLPVPSDPTTASSALVDAAQCIETAIAAGQSSPDAAGDLTAALRTSMTKLGGAVADQIMPLLPASESALVDDIRTASPASLSKLARQVMPLLGANDACTVLTVQALTDTILRISDCLGAGGDAPKLIACLDACVAQLRAAYAECVTRTIVYPNHPFLPVATGVGVSYGATVPVDGVQATAYHHLAFGGWSPLAQDLVPGTLVPTYAAQGNLYLGFRQLSAAPTLSLLMRMAADGADPDPQVQPSWAMLCGNDWRPISGRALRLDTTSGLRGTGAIELALPLGDHAPGTVFPGDLDWLRVAVAGDAGAFPSTLAVAPNTATATWVDNGAVAHLAQPLPPGSIAGPQQPITGIQAVSQPMESMGGRAPQSQPQFEVSEGERLRHKARAALGWDYERLALDMWPSLFKVKVLPACDATGEPAPGAVTLIAVAGPNAGSALAPLTPLAPPELLEAVQGGLAARASPFARLQVVNPVYVPLHVTALVQFTPDRPTGAGVDLLNADLVDWLSPWSHGADTTRYWEDDEITRFIETRPYVEALIDVRYELGSPADTAPWFFITSSPHHTVTDYHDQPVTPVPGY